MNLAEIKHRIATRRAPLVENARVAKEREEAFLRMQALLHKWARENDECAEDKEASPQ